MRVISATGNWLPPFRGWMWSWAVTPTPIWNSDDPKAAALIRPWSRGATAAKFRVVQTHAYGKYLGHLKLTFDDKGKLTKAEGADPDGRLDQAGRGDAEADRRTGCAHRGEHARG